MELNYDLDPNSRTEAGISIHAGFPNPATDKRLRSLDLNQLLVPRPSSTFMFRIKASKNRYTSSVADGDIAIVDRAISAKKNDVVLWHDGQQFKLSAPKHIETDGTVWGVVTAIIHRYRKMSDGRRD